MYGTCAFSRETKERNVDLSNHGIPSQCDCSAIVGLIAEIAQLRGRRNGRQFSLTTVLSLVEHRGIEPLTSALRTPRSPS